MATPRDYPDPEGDPNLGPDSTRDLEALTEHIAKNFGEGKVLHEIASDYVHIDLHVIPANQNRPYHFVLTTGMSDKPMKAPEKYPDYKYAELFLALPASWPLDEEAFKDEEVWWPFRHLKQTARFPHVNNAWLWFSHTIGNENPPQPFTERAQFAGSILYRPQLVPIEACNLTVREGKHVVFLPFVPLYESELRFAWENGSSQLAMRLKANNVTELVDPSRPPVI